MKQRGFERRVSIADIRKLGRTRTRKQLAEITGYSYTYIAEICLKFKVRTVSRRLNDAYKMRMQIKSDALLLVRSKLPYGFHLMRPNEFDMNEPKNEVTTTKKKVNALRNKLCWKSQCGIMVYAISAKKA